jgi:hypothetical protein
MRGTHLASWLCVLAVSQAIAAGQPPTASTADSVQPDQSTQSATASPTVATPATTTPAPSSAAAKPASTGAAPVELKASDKEAEAQIKRLKAAGYKPVLVNGEIVFCRKERAMDSHFEEKHCGTAEQLAAEADAGKQATENVQRNSQVPRGN